MAAYGTTDRCTGGVATADSIDGSYVASNAFDNNTGTTWFSAKTACPHWLKYACAAGLTWSISKVTLQSFDTGRGGNAFTINGSNNDSDYPQLYSGNLANNGDVQTFTFVNRVKYRYIKVIFTSSYSGDGQVGFKEMEMFEGLYPTGGLGIGNPMIF